MLEHSRLETRVKTLMGILRGSASPAVHLGLLRQTACADDDKDEDLQEIMTWLVGHDASGKPYAWHKEANTIHFQENGGRGDVPDATVVACSAKTTERLKRVREESAKPVEIPARVGDDDREKSLSFSPLLDFPDEDWQGEHGLDGMIQIGMTVEPFTPLGALNGPPRAPMVSDTLAILAPPARLAITLGPSHHMPSSQRVRTQKHASQYGSREEQEVDHEKAITPVLDGTAASSCGEDWVASDDDDFMEPRRAVAANAVNVSFRPRCILFLNSFCSGCEHGTLSTGR